MQLFAFGINHQSAPLDVRERVVFQAERLAHALHDLVGRRTVKEAAILSTCNRTEIYCSTDRPETAVEWLAGYHQMKAQALAPYLYEFSRDSAVKHAFRVASGLDSMVLGEPQILGQLKDAIDSAEQAGTLGLVLNRLFQRTFSVAKEVRTRTQIGAGSVSLASAAVRIAERIFPGIGDTRILFIGAGEMIELNAAHFCARSPRGVVFANRTLERGAALAERFGGTAIALADLHQQLAFHDIVVSCTASPLPIIGKGMVESALKARRHRPMLLIDLAVPRDIEAEVAELDDAFIYSVDDLGRVAADGLAARRNAVSEAEAIISAEVREFVHWLDTREVVPTIRALRDSAERARRHELERALKSLARGDDPDKVLEALSQSLTNKLLHAPTQALNTATDEERGRLVDTLARLYQLPREP